MDPLDPASETSSPESRIPRPLPRFIPWLISKKWLLGIAVLACLAVPAATYALRQPVVPFANITIESTPQGMTACIYQAKLRGYFAAEGLNVHINDHLSGRQALATMLEKGSDYAICAETPFTRAYAQAAPVTAIAGLGNVSNFIQVLGRRDRGITELPSSLVGHRIGMTRGTNAEYIVYITCLLFDLPQDQITLVDLNPEDLEPALINGTVDAVSMWEPFASRTSAVLASQVVQVEISDFYRAMWLVVAHAGKRDPRCERAILRALIRATQDLTHDRERWLGPLAREMSRTTDELRRDLQQAHTRVTMDQSLLLNLEAQRRWLNLGGPEIFDGLSPLALSEVDPQAVNLIHPEVMR